jgi:formate dehydrogenase maturation protein FdhE
MMRTILYVCVAVFLATVTVLAQGGSLSVPYSVDQQAGMQYGLDMENAHRAAQDEPLPPLTLQQFGIQRCQEVFDDYAAKRAREHDAAVRVQYLQLSDADQAQVDALIDSLINP